MNSGLEIRTLQKQNVASVSVSQYLHIALIVTIMVVLLLRVGTKRRGRYLGMAPLWSLEDGLYVPFWLRRVCNPSACAGTTPCRMGYIRKVTLLYQRDVCFVQGCWYPWLRVRPSDFACCGVSPRLLQIEGDSDSAVGPHYASNSSCQLC